ncbi:MAG: hypothetical protein ACI4JN_11910 [Ruminococcus sp.]
MVGAIVLSAIIILIFIAAVEAINIFQSTENFQGEELKAFTVLVYRRDDLFFEKELLSLLSQMRWTEPCFCREIYVVHVNVPEEQSENIRKLCADRSNLVYISIDDFVKLMQT